MDNEKIFSAKTARAKGLKRYFSGEPCKRGHVAERQASNNECVECRREDYEAWSVNRVRKPKTPKSKKPKAPDYFKESYFVGPPCPRALRHYNPTYSGWKNARNRCYTKTHKSYPNYGGRGITMCERWATFKNFLEDMGECPPGMSLDRYPDVNGNYEPGNCRWATAKQQANNRRPRKLSPADN